MNNYAELTGKSITIDNTPPTLQATYSINATQGNTKVTITANEPIKNYVNDNRTWNYVAGTNKKSITATITSNVTNELLTIKDLVGNASEIAISAKGEDHAAPTVTVTTDKTEYKPSETAVITATFSEDVKDGTPKISINGVSSLPETAMVKRTNNVYTYNYKVPNVKGTQTITISGATDIAGNVMQVNNTKTFNIVIAQLESIKISTPPSKTAYIEGQNFDKSGMKVTAKYSDNTEREITNYTVTDGNNLTIGKTSVTISYTESGITKTAMQAITVNKKAFDSIKITKAPNKISYKEGQNFDATGMKVIAKYNDDTEKEVTNYTVTDGNNLTIGKTSVTISYTENGVTKTTTQPVIVTKGLEIVINDYDVVNNDGKNYSVIDKDRDGETTSTITTVKEVIDNIKTSEDAKVTIYDKDNKEITDEESKVTTGCTVKISVGDEEEEFTIVVRGDIDGDGETTINDLFELNKHRLGKVLLEGEELIAGDLDGNGIVDIYDLFKMNYYRIDKK